MSIYLSDATLQLFKYSLSSREDQQNRIYREGKTNYLLPYISAFEQAFHDESLIRAVGHSMGINIRADTDQTAIDIFLDKIMSVIKLSRTKTGIQDLQWIIDMNECEWYDYLEANMDSDDTIEDYDYNDRLYQFVMNELI